MRIDDNSTSENCVARAYIKYTRITTRMMHTKICTAKFNLHPIAFEKQNDGIDAPDERKGYCQTFCFNNRTLTSALECE